MPNAVWAEKQAARSEFELRQGAAEMATADRQDSYRPLMLNIGRYVAAQALVALSTLVALWVAGRWGNAAVEMIYLPAVLAAGVWWGFGPAVVAAVTSALSYNYFFTEPLYTFRINSAVDIVDVIILFIVAVVTSQLASAIRKQAQIAEAHATRNATIAGFARRLLSCSSEVEIAQTVCDEISAIFDGNVVVLSGIPQPETIASSLNIAALTPTDIAAAVHTLQSGEVAGHGSGSLAPAEWVFHPIRSDASVIAALGLSRDDGSKPVTEEQEPLLESLLDQTALAMTRARESHLPPAKRAAAR
jgi:two-component system, OmpR family, sensor histidine kinase KdpD